jgi:fructose-1,6-bisphosphatase/inositol monophosphatase family enzyme
MRETLEWLAASVASGIDRECAFSERAAEVGMGADGTPTCRIDQAAEDMLLRLMDERNVPLNVLSEEAGLVDRGYDRTLVMDPVDGTYNALMGIPFYSVSLAVCTRSMNDATHGIVQNLVTGDLFYAERGKGATWNGRAIRVRKCQEDSSVLFVYLGKYSAATANGVLRKARRTRSMGCSSLEMCLVAAGLADGFYLHSEVYQRALRVVDIAASALILREAGGELYDLSGKVLDMDLDLNVRANCLAAGDAALLRWVL